MSPAACPRLRGMPVHVRAVSIGPGETREVDTRDYAGSLVLVDGGEIELVCGSGACRRFADGDMFWVEGLGVRHVVKVSSRRTRVVAVARAADESGGRASSNRGRPNEETQK